MSDYDISKAFEHIENELIDSMMRNFSRHRAEETKEGYNWLQWQGEMLKSFEQYKQSNREKFPKQFKSLNTKISEMIRTTKDIASAKQEREILKAIQKGFACVSPSAGSQAKFFKINERKLNALIKATASDMEKAEYAVLRMSNDKYRKAIFNAQVYANTGAGTYEKAVDMAVKDMLSAGLNCVEYKNGARHTLSDYADMAIRTANKRAYLYGEGEKRQEFGITTVIVNRRNGACGRCADFVGQVFIDDVYSGGKKSNGNYPLLSDAIAGGLFHPRCKDSTSTYFEGISTPPDKEVITRSEQEQLNEQERLESRVKYCERSEKMYSRLEKYALDSENKAEYGARAQSWQNQTQLARKKLDDFVAKSAQSGIIREQSKKRIASAKTDLITTAKNAKTHSEFLSGSKSFSKENKEKLYQHERIISRNRYETAIIYDSNGNVKFKKKGKSYEVSFSSNEIKNMKGCILTHNHPNGTVFSPEDINMLKNGRLAEIRACNGQGSYVLRSGKEWHQDISDLNSIRNKYWECMNEVGAKYRDISAQEGKSIMFYARQMDEEGISLFAKKYGLDFEWEEK